MEWVESVEVPKTDPLSNIYGSILLLMDGSKTHLSLDMPQKMKRH